MTHSNGSKPKKLLIITSSGGGGLIQTANAKEQEALQKDPSLIVVRVDLLKNWVWKPLGNFFINFWNKAQLKGNISAQMICVSGQFLVDYFLHPMIFFQALYTTFKEDVDYIIDTQPMGTSAILKAIRIFNRKKAKSVRLEKVLVDLPTKKAIHFFRSIKKLSKKNRECLLLTSIAPLLEEGETAEEFWQKNCGLSEKEVNCEEVYVRQAFRKYKRKERSSEPVHIKVRYKNEEELGLLERAFKRGPIQAQIKRGGVDFQINPEDRLFTVLLGSQPAGMATLNYVKGFTEVAREFPHVNTYVFAFCGDHHEGEETLLRKMSHLVSKIKDYPSNLSIVPFSFQDEHVIAPLFHRSDITCTRSGGQTAMELMCVSTGEIWIHSEAKKNQNVLKGISGWEAESAVYLQKMRGAKILTPETFIPHAKQVYQIDSLQGLSKIDLESTA